MMNSDDLSARFGDEEQCSQDAQIVEVETTSHLFQLEIVLIHCMQLKRK